MTATAKILSMPSRFQRWLARAVHWMRYGSRPRRRPAAVRKPKRRPTAVEPRAASALRVVERQAAFGGGAG